MLFGQHFDSEMPGTENHVFLTEQFGKKFQQKISFVLKNQSDALEVFFDASGSNCLWRLSLVFLTKYLELLLLLSRSSYLVG